MSDETSTRLGLPFLAAGQLQKHVTLNAALSRLDSLMHLSVVSRSVAEQPVDPDEGCAWLVPTGATGIDWGTLEEGAVAVFEDGGWSEVRPPVGAIALVADEDRLIVRTAGGWTRLGDRLGRIDFVDRLGVGGSPDAANPLSARLNGALLTALPEAEGGSGDVRLTLNKETTVGVASVLFQTAFGGRAEIGLTGDDRLSLKVSPDGVTWQEGLSVDPADGRVSFPGGSLRRETTVLSSAGAYTPPVWARRLEALVIGAGGGGGGGQGGAAGTLRMGGGGGGAGGHAHATWPIEGLVGALTVTVGAGGSGGAPGGAGTGGGDSSLRLDGVILLRAFGGGGGASSGAAGVGGLAARTGNGGGPSFPAATASGGAASTNPEGGGGGGGGGAVTAVDVALAGGPGGAGAVMAVSAAGGAGGSGAGTAGTGAPLVQLCRAGGGGGGGGGASAAAGHPGGSGGIWGAGGGGGGAGLGSGGAGGAGGAGLVVLTAVG
jgi:hypothetical protein